MKICYFANADSIHTQRWISYYADCGHEIHLISREAAKISHPNVIYHGLRPWNLNELIYGQLPGIRAIERMLRFRSDVRTIIKKLNPDLVHGHYISEYGILANFSDCQPMVLTAWGSDIYLYHSQSLLIRYLAKNSLRRASLITCDSNDLRQNVIKLGIDPQKVIIIQFGVDTNRFKPSSKNNRMRLNRGLSAEKYIILSPRSLQPHYNIDTIVRGFAIFHSQIPDSTLVIKDFYGYPLYREEIKTLIRELLLDNHVVFLGEVPYSEMPSIYNLADVVVSLATTDGTPMSLLESMACGKTNIASNLSSLKEWIKDGVNGYLADPKNPEEVAQKLLLAYSLDPETIQEWSERNRDIVLEKGDYSKNMTKMETIYRELINHYG